MQQRRIPRKPLFSGVHSAPLRFEGKIYPVPACTILIRETISRKNELNDSIFQIPHSSRRKRFPVLMRVFMQVRKMRGVCSFLSLWGKAGQGEEQAPLGSRGGWSRRLGSPRGIALGRCTSQRPALPQPWLLERFRWGKTQTPTPPRHRPGIPNLKLSTNTCSWLLALGRLPCLRAMPPAHLRPPLLCGHHINPSLLVKGVGFNFPSGVLLLPRDGREMVKFREQSTLVSILQTNSLQNTQTFITHPVCEQ